MKERVVYIDIARGIAIIGMLIGHAMYLFNCRISYVMDWFWSFHMPLFAILAGYFFKDYGLKQHLFNGFKTLIVPYYIVAFTSLFTLILIHIINGTVNLHFILSELWNVLYINPNTIPFGFWFVFALFVARLLFCVIKKTCHDDICQALVSFSLFVLAYYFTPINQSYLQWSQAMMFPLYMTIGNKLKETYLSHHNNHNNNCLVFISLIILLFAGNFNVDLSVFMLPLGLCNIVSTSIICISLLYFCKFISSSKRYIIINILGCLAYCGKHSLMILSVHSYLIYIQFWKKVGLESPIILSVIFVLGTIVLTLIIDKLLFKIKN